MTTPEPDIDYLIERSSLGTPGAKALRAGVSPEVARAVVDRAQELERSVVEVRANTFEPFPVTAVTDEPTYKIPWPLWKALCDAQHAVEDAHMEIMRYIGEHYPAADEVRDWVTEYDV